MISPRLRPFFLWGRGGAEAPNGVVSGEGPPIGEGRVPFPKPMLCLNTAGPRDPSKLWGQVVCPTFSVGRLKARVLLTLSLLLWGEAPSQPFMSKEGGKVGVPQDLFLLWGQ